MWLQKYQKLKLLVFSYHKVWNLILQDTTPNKILSLKTEKLSSLWNKNNKSSKNMKMEQHKNWKNQPHRRFSAFIFRICKYFEKLDHLIIVRNLTVKVSECRFCVHKSLCVVVTKHCDIIRTILDCHKRNPTFMRHEKIHSNFLSCIFFRSSQRILVSSILKMTG